MSPPIEVMAELFRQLAFISALIGGFSLAFLVQLLAAHFGHRIADWTIGFSMAATAGLIVCAVGWTLSAVVVIDPAAQAETMRLSGTLTHLHMRLTDGFVMSLLLFFVSLGVDTLTSNGHRLEYDRAGRDSHHVSDSKVIHSLTKTRGGRSHISTSEIPKGSLYDRPSIIA